MRSLKPARPAGIAFGALGILCAFLPGPLHASTAQYQVTFESTWSQTTHPIQFPASAHFSGLIGGTHNDQVAFWNVGAPASLGIKNMAEQGSKVALTQEVQTAIAAGTADAVLSGGGISPSPGSVTLTFTADEAFPLVTLVSMLAPSPDWFVGVSGLSLRANGDWVSQLVVPLRVHDAGTDSGPSYSSPDQPTLPPVPVFENMSGPFASNNLVGSFTFVRTGILGGGPAGEPAPLVALGPNPIRGDARFQIHVPSGRSGELTVYGVRGDRIRGLFRGGTAGQTSIVSWNRRDDHGTPVPPGIYLVALRVDGATQGVSRVVVTR